MNGPNVCKIYESMLGYQHEQPTLHLIVYHIIWCPKRRRQVLQGQLAERLEQIVHEAAKERKPFRSISKGKAKLDVDLRVQGSWHQATISSHR